MITFEPIDVHHIPFGDKYFTDGGNIFQTIEWLDYISEIRNARPVVIAIKSSGKLQGYFFGLITIRFGLKILGSPFRGWQTYFMGFNLLPTAPKCEILVDLMKYAFNELNCQYINIIDPSLSANDWLGSSYKSEYLRYYGIDLTKSEDVLFMNMDSAGRNCIRKSIKNGIVIDETTDLSFAEEYYAQYTDVMARHSLTPAYSLNDVRKLIDYILPTGNLLLLRAKNTEGVCIATGMFLALNKVAVFWGAASWRQYQYLRPNEPIAWYGIKEMKARGIQVLHLGGKCEHYKEKLGATELPLYRLMKSKTELLDFLIYPFMFSKNEGYKNWILQRLSR